jgi:hypothetical protein
VRAVLVIVASPMFDFLASIGDVEEHFPIQTFVPQSAVETLDVAVLNGMAWPDEVHLHSGLIGPGFHGPARELPPLSVVMESGAPRNATSRFICSTTFSPVWERSAKAHRHSRVY